MQGLNQEIVERMKKTIINDVNGSVDTTLRVLRSDLFSLFSQFMEFEKEDLTMELSIHDEGFYTLDVHVKASQILPAGYTLEE